MYTFFFYLNGRGLEKYVCLETCKSDFWIYYNGKPMKYTTDF